MVRIVVCMVLRNGFDNVNLDLSKYGLQPDVVIPYLVMAAAFLEAGGEWLPRAWAHVVDNTCPYTRVATHWRVHLCVHSPVVPTSCFTSPGALALLTGGENCGTIMLMLMLVPTTAIMHWPLDAKGDVNFVQLISLLKNVAILGGLMIVRNSMPRKLKQE